MNYKRKRPRTRTTHSPFVNRQCRGGMGFLKRWPRAWDVVMHTRPRRRRQREHLVQLRKGEDPDGILWESSNHKPHRYYW